MTNNATVRDDVIHIDKKQALKLVSEVVKKRGADATNGDICVYERNGQPSCAVGEALFLAGVPIETLRELDDPGLQLFAIDPQQYGFSLTDGAYQVLVRFQEKADMGRSFGEAAREARKV